MRLEFAEDNSPFSKHVFQSTENSNDAYLHNFRCSIGLSDIYFKDREPLPYIAEFQIHLTPLDSQTTEVSVVVHDPVVIWDVRPQLLGHGNKVVIQSVPATTIEEYEILLRIGDYLRAVDMPPITRP